MFRHKQSVEPFAQRVLFCMGIALAIFLALMLLLPETFVSRVPMIREATIIHGLILGWGLALSGFVNWCPFLQTRIHPFLRGALITAFLHLDFAIYTWPVNLLFWKMILTAAAFGGALDLLATDLFGDGKKLAKGYAE